MRQSRGSTCPSPAKLSTVNMARAFALRVIAADWAQSIDTCQICSFASAVALIELHEVPNE